MTVCGAIYWTGDRTFLRRYEKEMTATKQLLSALKDTWGNGSLGQKTLLHAQEALVNWESSSVKPVIEGEWNEGTTKTKLALLFGEQATQYFDDFRTTCQKLAKQQRKLFSEQIRRAQMNAHQSVNVLLWGNDSDCFHRLDSHLRSFKKDCKTNSAGGGASGGHKPG